MTLDLCLDVTRATGLQLVARFELELLKKPLRVARRCRDRVRNEVDVEQDRQGLEIRRARQRMSAILSVYDFFFRGRGKRTHHALDTLGSIRAVPDGEFFELVEQDPSFLADRNEGLQVGRAGLTDLANDR